MATKKKAEQADSDKPKFVVTGPRTHGKKHRAASEKIVKNQAYPLAEALELLQQTSTTKFDSSAEVHINLNVDLKASEQMIRGTIGLPHGTGKTVRVIAFVDDGKIKECKAAGAVDAGSTDLVEKIVKGWMEFDVAVAAPDQMKNLGKIAKTLGQKGLMPNPKAGTVTPEPAKVIQEIIKGRVEYKMDKQGNLHNSFGKLSFGSEKLSENLKSYLKTIKESRPAGIKGNFMNSITICSTMGPGIKVAISEA